MTQVSIPNRPLGSDTRSIEMILADFDAITAVINGELDATNMSPTGQSGMYLPGDLIISAAATRAGCLLCNGAAVSRGTYAPLFTAIGTAFGAGDGSSTFNVPNYLGRVIVGAGSGSGLTARGLGSSGGEESHVLSPAELASHGHGITDPGHGHGITDPGHAHGGATGSILATGGANVNLGAGGIAYAYTTTDSRGTGVSVQGSGTGVSVQANGSNYGHNNMQPFGTANVFIKT